ncbi:hypothetical protein L596_029370 [Steinernema carpocapsae]|uniref:Uncharacterized protein n=1 Tax=Steinernema carpocapsae TaxID=34508 RepID=A0A4U5LUF7_STECR|nr:hypothetical protein L596_029370 [Steinernema carpocapsae]
MEPSTNTNPLLLPNSASFLLRIAVGASLPDIYRSTTGSSAAQSVPSTGVIHIKSSSASPSAPFKRGKVSQTIGEGEGLRRDYSIPNEQQRLLRVTQRSDNDEDPERPKNIAA